MAQSKGNSIVYEVPHRGLVTVPFDRASWPMKVGEIGYVPHWAVVPDPDQPREEDDFDPMSLAELGESVKTNGQSEVTKVCLLTPDEQETFRLRNGNLPMYMLVSGERRWRGMAADVANVPLIEVRVATYKDKKTRFLDAFTINAHREDLPPRSVAKSLKRLLNEHCGGNVAELCRITRKSRPYVDTYLRINNLVPEVAELLSPRLPEDKRMGVMLASFLGQLTHEEQRRYIKPLTSGEGGRSMTQQIRWLTDQLARAGGRHEAPRKDFPAEIRGRLERLVDSSRSHATMLLTVTEQTFADGFRRLSVQECENLLRQLETAQELVEKVRTRVKLATAGKLSFGERNQDLLASSGWRVVDYYERGRGALNRGVSVSPGRYEELKKWGWLKWQRDGEPDPDLPSTPSEGVANGASAMLPTSPAAPTVRVSFYYRNGGRQEQLAEGQLVDKQQYAELRTEGRLFWQRRKLQPSSTEDEFCKTQGLAFA